MNIPDLRQKAESGSAVAQTILGIWYLEGVEVEVNHQEAFRLLSAAAAQGGVTIDGASYGLDNAGNRTAKSDLYAGVTTNYGYDATYELLNASQSGASTESYTYDPVGNRLSNLSGSAWSYNTSNELSSRPGVSYTYDANGNTTSKTDSTGTTTYSWDFEDRLASAALPGSGGTVYFRYDPFDRRIYKQSPTATSIFAYDGVNLIETVNASGTVVARYSQGLTIDEPLVESCSGTSSYYEADGLGSITTLSNTAGTVAENYTYDSFGNLVATSGSIVNSFRYTGREWDSETSLYYYRARYYDASGGRFLSEDPIAFEAGPNFYAYVGNNPTVFFDPTGNNGVIDTILNYLFPPPPSPPVPSNIAGPGSPPILITNMNGGQPGGSTTFYPGNGDPVITIPTLTKPDSHAKPGAGGGYCSTVVGVVYTGGGNRAYGTDGAFINTGDSRGRAIHGGGSSLGPNAFDPIQPLTPTSGCTRGHNQDVNNLGNAIKQYQQKNPGFPIPYCRK
jgi:RHS repeat-associated protein